jgi:hypothetical protein
MRALVVLPLALASCGPRVGTIYQNVDTGRRFTAEATGDCRQLYDDHEAAIRAAMAGDGGRPPLTEDEAYDQLGSPVTMGDTGTCVAFILVDEVRGRQLTSYCIWNPDRLAATGWQPVR